MMTRDETHTQQIITYIQENMTDPFEVHSHPELLVNIGSGLVATSEVSNSLLNAKNTGLGMMSNFVESRLSQDAVNPKSFYHPITKSGLLTFKHMQNKTNVKMSETTRQSAVFPELIYQRAL